MRYNISKENLKQVLNYLGTRPYAETFKLINAMQTDVKLEESCEEPKEAAAEEKKETEAIKGGVKRGEKSSK